MQFTQIRYLATAISQHCTDIDYEYVFSNIERAHRGKVFYTHGIKSSYILPWAVSEHIKTSIIQENKVIKNNPGNPKKSLRVSQMFSPGTTKRQNEALKEWKNLMIQNKHVEYVISYPARILGRPKLPFVDLDGQKYKEKFKVIMEF